MLFKCCFMPFRLSCNPNLSAQHNQLDIKNTLKWHEILLLLLLLVLKIFKEGWLFSCRCFSRGPPFKYILQLKRNTISIKNLITTATKVSEELYTIMKTKKQVIKVDC